MNQKKNLIFTLVTALCFAQSVSPIGPIKKYETPHFTDLPGGAVLFDEATWRDLWTADTWYYWKNDDGVWVCNTMEESEHEDAAPQGSDEEFFTLTHDEDLYAQEDRYISLLNRKLLLEKSLAALADSPPAPEEDTEPTPPDADAEAKRKPVTWFADASETSSRDDLSTKLAAIEQRIAALEDSMPEDFKAYVAEQLSLLDPNTLGPKSEAPTPDRLSPVSEEDEFESHFPTTDYTISQGMRVFATLPSQEDLAKLYPHKLHETLNKQLYAKTSALDEPKVYRLSTDPYGNRALDTVKVGSEMFLVVWNKKTSSFSLEPFESDTLHQVPGAPLASHVTPEDCAPYTGAKKIPSRFARRTQPELDYIPTEEELEDLDLFANFRIKGKNGDFYVSIDPKTKKRTLEQSTYKIPGKSILAEKIPVTTEEIENYPTDVPLKTKDGKYFIVLNLGKSADGTSCYQVVEIKDYEAWKKAEKARSSLDLLKKQHRDSDARLTGEAFAPAPLTLTSSDLQGKTLKRKFIPVKETSIDELLVGNTPSEGDPSNGTEGSLLVVGKQLFKTVLNANGELVYQELPVKEFDATTQIIPDADVTDGELVWIGDQLHKIIDSTPLYPHGLRVTVDGKPHVVVRPLTTLPAKWKKWAEDEMPNEEFLAEKWDAGESFTFNGVIYDVVEQEVTDDAPATFVDENGEEKPYSQDLFRGKDKIKTTKKVAVKRLLKEITGTPTAADLEEVGENGLVYVDGKLCSVTRSQEEALLVPAEPPVEHEKKAPTPKPDTDDEDKPKPDEKPKTPEPTKWYNHTGKRLAVVNITGFILSTVLQNMLEAYAEPVELTKKQRALAMLKAIISLSKHVENIKSLGRIAFKKKVSEKATEASPAKTLMSRFKAEFKKKPVFLTGLGALTCYNTYEAVTHPKTKQLGRTVKAKLGF